MAQPNNLPQRYNAEQLWLRVKSLSSIYHQQGSTARGSGKHSVTRTNPHLHGAEQWPTVKSAKENLAQCSGCKSPKTLSNPPSPLYMPPPRCTYYCCGSSLLLQSLNLLGQFEFPMQCHEHNVLPSGCLSRLTKALCFAYMWDYIHVYILPCLTRIPMIQKYI